MKTEKNILIAFILNISFSIIEFFGGLITGSVAILSDSVYDFGDATSIGISYFMERKSKKGADKNYTYGYIRYSVLGGVITTCILIVGSIFVILGALNRLFHPVQIDYSGMIIFAVLGVILNFAAAYITKEGDSINQKSVNLHMLEDVLGWIVVLFGAIIMKFTDILVIDSIMSIGVAIFILTSSLKNLKKVLDLFLAKTPSDIDIDVIKSQLMKIKEVDGVHHVHVWSIDGFNNYATMHVVVKSKSTKEVKEIIRKELKKFNIYHVIIETEENTCGHEICMVNSNINSYHNH